MTWAEWCESDYNIPNYTAVQTVSGDYVKMSEIYYVGYNNTYVSPSDAIVPDAAYTRRLIGGT